MLTDNIYANRRSSNGMTNLVREFNTCNKSPHIMFPDKRFLTLIACHPDTTMKLNTAINNLRYVSFPTNKVVVVSSNNAQFSEALKKWVTSQQSDRLEYMGIPNDSKRLDIAKWMHYLRTYYKDRFHRVVFLNDSILISKNIYHFFNASMRSSAHLYGFNDSDLIKYHFQSYLFTLVPESISKFIAYYAGVESVLNGYDSVVGKIELMLVDIFTSHDCFLKLTQLAYGRVSNIYTIPLDKYRHLYKYGILPFYKLKALNGVSQMKSVINDTKRRILMNGL